MTPRRMLPIDGERLRQLRERKLWLISDLSEQSGIHRNLISRYEHGQSGASPESVRSLAAALEVAPETLIAGASVASGPQRRRRGLPRVIG